MKKLFALAVSAPLTLAACAPSATSGAPLLGSDPLRTQVDLKDRPDGISYLFLSPTQVRVHVTPPAAFPNPARNLYFTLNCEGGIENQPNLDEYLKSRSGAFKDMSLTAQDYVVGCEDGFVFAQASNIYRTLSALSGDLAGRFGGDGFEILREDGYLYPNLKLDYYRNYLTVEFTGGRIRAYDGERNRKDVLQRSIVGMKQGGGLQQVMYADKNTPVTFDPSKPVSIPYMLTGNSWYQIDLHVSAGKVAWKKLPAAPQ